jgi:undecaprenyl phosphate N,N'-diacetylbacillosamine 1-phosphate transferase
LFLILKRLLDFTVSLAGLICLLPLFILVAVAIKLDDRGPVFFRQERVGLEGRPFLIFKFRTMIVNAEKVGAGVFVEKNDARITRIGKFLRHTSLDELPQLINIFRGDMSLVGPRPTLSYQVEKYDDRQRRRLKAKPGVTGWAQVNGRSALTWPERIELDLWYIDNWSLYLDLKILVKTFRVVAERGNLYKTAIYDPISGEMKNTDANNDNEG